MENNKPVSSRRICAGTRVYYLDVRRDSKKQPYVSISEIPTDTAPKNKRRQRIFIHSDKLDGFIQALSEVAEQIKNEAEG